MPRVQLALLAPGPCDVTGSRGLLGAGSGDGPRDE